MWDQTKFIASPKGAFLLQLFADLHPVFSKRFLHKVDGEEVVIWEVHPVTHENANVLLDENLYTPFTDAIHERLKEDQHCNIITDFDIKDTVTLNTKLKGSHNLACVKDKLTECKKKSCSAWQTTS